MIAIFSPQAMDFSYSSDHERVGLFMKEAKGKYVDVWSYVRIFRPLVWLSSLALIMLVTILIWVSFHQPISDSCVTVLNLFLQLPTSLDPQSRGQKSLLLTLWFFVYLLFAHFNAQVIMFMTVSETFPLSSYIETLEPRFSPVVFGSSAFHTLLQKSKPGTDLFKVYTKRFKGKPDSLVWSTKESLNRMLAEPNLVLFTAEASDFPGCYAVPLDWYVKSRLGFGLQKDSEFKRVFDHLGLKIQESGIFEKLRRRLRKRGVILKNEATPLGIREMAFPFSCLATGALLAGVLAVLEKIRFWRASHGLHTC